MDGLVQDCSNFCALAMELLQPSHRNDTEVLKYTNEYAKIGK